MQEVLDSIEKGVEDERQSGHLQPEEAEVCDTPCITLHYQILTAFELCSPCRLCSKNCAS